MTEMFNQSQLIFNSFRNQIYLKIIFENKNEAYFLRRGINEVNVTHGIHFVSICIMGKSFLNVSCFRAAFEKLLGPRFEMK
jgi:hypothetical protein